MAVDVKKTKKLHVLRSQHGRAQTFFIFVLSGLAPQGGKKGSVGQPTANMKVDFFSDVIFFRPVFRAEYNTVNAYHVLISV